MMLGLYRRRTRRVHFVGIGGIGMSGIAEVLLNQGFGVSGSDLKASETTERLASMGAIICQGHAPENIADGNGAADVVVTSTAVRADNPEVVAAHERGIPVIPRAEMLAELMRMKDGVAVAGMHGKTSTTSLAAHLMGEAGLDPTVIIGGKVNQLGSNAKLGSGPFLVAEADESDGSFLKLSPTIAVVTNMDPEHLDYWKGGMDAIKEGFVAFLNRLPFYGLAILCLDNPHVQSILPQVTRRHVTYGLTAQAEYRATHIQLSGLTSMFMVHRRDQALGEVTLAMVGQHNVQNALAVVALADELEVPFETVQMAFSTFGGVQRRFTVKGDQGGVLVVDDYGHHPTEIGVTLTAARAAYPERRLVVVFQPHRYTRTRDLMEEFSRSFNDAELLVITDIYAASEEPIDGVSGEHLVEAIRKHGHRDVHHVPRSGLVDAVVDVLKAGDLVLTLGAGDVTYTGEQMVKALASRGGGG